MKALNRRQMLIRTTQSAAALAVGSPMLPLLAAPGARTLKIGACDWSLDLMGDTKAFEVAKQIGLDGVQVSLGTKANNMQLRQAEVQAQFQTAAKANGVEIASLAIGELNEVPYKSDARAEVWVSDCVEVMQALGVKVVLLPFFSKGDLDGDEAGANEVVRRLQKVAPKAEKADVILGLESWMSAEDTLRILERVNSPAVKMYYDVANSTKRGHDVPREIRRLGCEHICELHMKENGALLGQGKVDFPQVRAAIKDIGYESWVQIEGGVPPGGKVVESYKANLAYLRRLFAE